jgi:hypothetical protein
MTEDEMVLQVHRSLGAYLSALGQVGAPYSPDQAAWQQQAGEIATAAQAVYRDQGPPPPPVQGADPELTLASQVETSDLVAGVPVAVDEHISTALAVGGVIAAAALLAPSAPEWAGLIATVGSNVFLWATAVGLEAAATAAGMVTKTWRAHPDDRTRPSHRIADGQKTYIGGYFVVGGFNLKYPHDPYGPPQETANCRCTLKYGR